MTRGSFKGCVGDDGLYMTRIRASMHRLLNIILILGYPLCASYRRFRLCCILSRTGLRITRPYRSRRQYVCWLLDLESSPNRIGILLCLRNTAHRIPSHWFCLVLRTRAIEIRLCSLSDYRHLCHRVEWVFALYRSS